MKRTLKYSIAVVVLILGMIWTPYSFAGVSPDEAAKLGTTLTGVGAEMAGNKDGTIPAYSGGLTKPPAGYKEDSGVYIDPFLGEKPLFSINAQNMAQYADKLTEGAKFMMSKHPTFRIDVYMTHRTVAFPEHVLKNTAENAVKAATSNGGLTVNNAWAGYPFPIPKDGFEVMWNHMMRYTGRAYSERYGVYVVDANGTPRLSQGTLLVSELPYYDKDSTIYDKDVYWKSRWHFIAPPRINGEMGMVMDYVDLYNKHRVAYQYLPGQRRVKLAPEIGFDTPVASQSGVSCYDEQQNYNGSMERYEMKLVGKKEVYIPYNDYDLAFSKRSMDQVMGPKHLNPDPIRWELHRVWVVEGTLKPGARHIYKTRRFYLDEDSWNVAAAETYDNQGSMFRIQFGFQVPMYDALAANGEMRVEYDVISGVYSLDFWWGGMDGYRRFIKPLPNREWAPQAIAGGGVS